MYSYKEVANREMSVPCLSFTVMDQLTQMDVDDIQLMNNRLVEVSITADERATLIEQMQGQIEVQRLRAEETMAELSQMRRDIDAALSRNQMYQDDLVTIGAALLAEAERRDWCEEYDTFIARVNENLRSSYRLSARQTLWMVEQSYTVTLRWQVEADNEEAAGDVARRNYNQIREAEVFVTDSLQGELEEITISWDADGRNVDRWEKD